MLFIFIELHYVGWNNSSHPSWIAYCIRERQHSFQLSNIEFLQFKNSFFNRCLFKVRWLHSALQSNVFFLNLCILFVNSFCVIDFAILCFITALNIVTACAWHARLKGYLSYLILSNKHFRVAVQRLEKKTTVTFHEAPCVWVQRGSNRYRSDSYTASCRSCCRWQRAICSTVFIGVARIKNKGRPKWTSSEWPIKHVLFYLYGFKIKGLCI